ncbi:ferredoxin [Mycobacterium sp. HM-7]
MTTIRVDRDLCLETGQCARILPGLFVLDNAGPVRLAGDQPSGPAALSSADLKQAHHAAATCPSAAITLEEQ